MQRGRGRWENRGSFSFFMTGLWFTVYDLWFLVYCARSIKYIYRHHIVHQGEREEGGGGCGWAQAVKYDQVFQIIDKDIYYAGLWFSSTKKRLIFASFWTIGSCLIFLLIIVYVKKRKHRRPSGLSRWILTGSEVFRCFTLLCFLFSQFLEVNWNICLTLLCLFSQFFFLPLASLSCLTWWLL